MSASLAVFTLHSDHLTELFAWQMGPLLLLLERFTSIALSLQLLVALIASLRPSLPPLFEGMTLS